MSQEQEREANFAGLCKQLYPRLEVADSIIVEALRKHGDEGLAMEEVANWQPWESSADLGSAAAPPPAAKPAPKPSAPAADVDNIERQKREFEKFEKANRERLENERKEKEKEEAARREAAKREEEARLLELAIAEEKAKQVEKERIAREEEQRRAREERAILARMERERAKQEELLKAKLKEEEEKRLKELQDKIDKEKERVRIEREKEEKEKREKEEKERRQKEEEERIEREVRERVEKEVLERIRKEEQEKHEKEAKEKREKEEQEAREKAEREAKEKADREAKEKREKEEQEAKEKAEQEAREKAEQEAKEKAEQEAKQKEEEAKAKAIEDAKDKGKEDQGKEVGDIMKELQDLKGMNVDFVGENAPPRVSIYVGKESDLSALDYQRVKDVFIKKEITEKQIRILDIATDREIEQFLKSSLKQDPLVFPLVCVDGQPIGTPADVCKMDDAKIEKILSSTPEAPLFHTGSDDAGSEVHLGALNQVLYAGEYLGSLLMMPVNVLTWPFMSDKNEAKQETDVEFDVIHTNWYWRSQWRVLRFCSTHVKRLGPRQRDFRAGHAYDTISLIRVTDTKNIVFHYNDDSSPDYVHAKEEDIKEMLRIVKAKKPDLMIEKGEKAEE